jgi:mono/diheme cytochrome c family protein
VSRKEFSLLAVGLAALAFGAGAVGWVIGHSGRPAAAVLSDQRSAGGASSAATRTSVPAPAPKGNPAAGKKVFVNAGCGSCHTLAATGANGTVGPNLDQTKLTAAEILDWVSNGKGAMPSFKSQLSEKELAALATFLAK